MNPPASTITNSWPILLYLPPYPLTSLHPSAGYVGGFVFFVVVLIYLFFSFLPFLQHTEFPGADLSHSCDLQHRLL